MKIYVSHSKHFLEYEDELYTPLLASFGETHSFIFPHAKSTEPYNTKELFESGDVDLIIAEVSYPATGQGVELGWADIYGIPIVAVYRFGTEPSGSLQLLTGELLEYQDEDEMVEKISQALELYQ
jgi:hypothetical protein